MSLSPSICSAIVTFFRLSNAISFQNCRPAAAGVVETIGRSDRRAPFGKFQHFKIADRRRLLLKQSVDWTAEPRLENLNFSKLPTGGDPRFLRGYI